MSVQAFIASNLRGLRRQREKEWQAHSRGTAPNPWSQGGIAQKLQISRSTYVNMESGRRNITIDDLLALAYAFDVSPMTLLMPPEDTTNIAVEASASYGHVVANAPVAAFRSWLSGVKHLPGQHGGFFVKNSLLHRPERGRPDARTAPWVSDSEPVDVPAVPAARREAESAMHGLWRALDSGDAETVEHFQELLKESLDAALGVPSPLLTWRPLTTRYSPGQRDGSQ